jgi:hypothetical protein
MDETSKATKKRWLSTRGLASRAEAHASTKELTEFLQAQLLADFPIIRLEDQTYSRADLLAISADGYVTEYEIKTGETDLHHELNKINTVIECSAAGSSRMDRLRQLRYDGMPERELARLIRKYCLDAEHSKYLKHEWYLDSQVAIESGNARKPNLFYFVVHAWLAPTAIRKLTGTPYGLISAEPQLQYLTVLKPATELHGELLTEENIGLS